MREEVGRQIGLSARKVQVSDYIGLFPPLSDPNAPDLVPGMCSKGLYRGNI